jgi:hypothetical protein
MYWFVFFTLRGKGQQQMNNSGGKSRNFNFLTCSTASLNDIPSSSFVPCGHINLAPLDMVEG